ncbi:MAG: teichoic acid ABC transporter ATP-binding protein [Marinilabiliales bacterium]|nr:MAG: teichoic acid ABC transporter ATP-binding protein [Marinilabiliales bacterium]
MEKVISLENITVSYLQNKNGIESVKDLLLKTPFRKPFQKYVVLKDFNLSVNKGESLGILGPNGCGKSTLLRTIAGIIIPDTGKINVTAKISPLLALGAGVELELTGYENIKIALALTGNYQRKDRKELIEKVAEFSELSTKHLKMPAKKYSSGMLARLSFSSIITNQPELLMIDEVLAVGDQGFQKKCKTRIHQIIEDGATMLFVSHNPNEVTELCTRGICIKDGKTIFDGNSMEAADIYRGLF